MSAMGKTSVLVSSIYVLLLSAVLAAPSDTLLKEAKPEEVQARTAQLESNEEDLDARSAYVNNQYVPDEVVHAADEQNEQNEPLYEMLQKQMEQVLADVPAYEVTSQKVKPPQKPSFTNLNPDQLDNYDDEQDGEDSYVELDKPDASNAEDEPAEQGGYQPLSLGTTTSVTPSPTSTKATRSRPPRRRTTTAAPRVTRTKNTTATQQRLTPTTPITLNNTTPSIATSPANVNKSRPSSRPNSNADAEIYQHKRHIIFKTISTGSQFVNSPIGDLMIKFSIGFAKPDAKPTADGTINEALRALSGKLLKSMELHRRQNKLQNL